MRPDATANGSRGPLPLQLVEPAALSLVVVSGVWSCVIHLPASLRSPGVTRLRRYYERSDSCPANRPAPGRSLCFMCLAFQPFRLQPPDCPAGRFRTLPLSSRGFPMGRIPLSGLGFAISQQARQPARPNRVHYRYGRVVRFPLLPTPPREDAVTFSYRPESACLKRTHTFPTKHTYRRTGRRL